MPHAMDELLHMSQAELDDLFRTSPAGAVPRGEIDGRLIVFPGTPIADIAGRLAHLMVWKGKVFDPDHGELLNKVTPLGVQNVRGKVYKGASWFDGNECIVLDYSTTSRVARWIRDEIREVTPGLYLGNVYWQKHRIAHLALQGS